MKIDLNFEIRMQGAKDEETLTNLIKTLKKVDEFRSLSDVRIDVVVNTSL